MTGALIGAALGALTATLARPVLHVLRGIRQDKARMARERIPTGDSDGLTRDWGWRS